MLLSKNIIIRVLFFFRCLRARKKLKKILPDENLEPGNYIVILSDRYFLVKEGLSETNKNILGIKNIKTIVRKLKNITSNTLENRGQALMLTANGARYFNFTKEQTFRFFSSKEEALFFNSADRKFSRVFKTTTISIRDKCIIEKIINNRSRKTWTDEETISNFYKLLDLYVDYLKLESANKFKEKYADIIKSKINEKLPIEFEKLYNQILCDVSNILEVDYVFCHCDLHFGNALYGEDDIYLIDFEYSRNEMFFYDIFNVMYVDYVDNRNSLLLDLYISEDIKMQHYIEQCFKAVNNNYDNNNKIKYFELYLLSRLVFSCFKRPLKTKKDYYKRIQFNVNSIRSVLNYIKNEDKINKYNRS